MMSVAVVAQGEPLLVRDVSVPTFSHQHFYDTSGDRNQFQGVDDLQGLQEKDFFLSEKVRWLEIVSELMRTVEGARELQPDLEIERVFLSGSFGSSPELLEELRQSLFIPISLIDPVASIGWNRGSARPLASFAGVAGGLALRAEHG